MLTKLQGWQRWL